MKHHVGRWMGLILTALCLSAGLIVQVARADEPAKSAFGEEVVQIVRSYDDGGGYIWKGSTGVSEPIIFADKTILDKQPRGTYCSGFTLQVAFKLAMRHGLFEGKSFKQVKQFQREWYGAVEQTAEVQCASAMVNLGIGRRVTHDEAQPGDFGNFWRTKSGHSVVFLNWVTDDDGNRIGIHYRSSQTKTDGIGDRTEYFKNHGGYVDPDRLYLCRFNTKQDEQADGTDAVDADNDADDASDDDAKRRGANR